MVAICSWPIPWTLSRKGRLKSPKTTNLGDSTSFPPQQWGVLALTWFLLCRRRNGTGGINSFGSNKDWCLAICRVMSLDTARIYLPSCMSGLSLAANSKSKIGSFPREEHDLLLPLRFQGCKQEVSGILNLFIKLIYISAQLVYQF